MKNFGRIVKCTAAAAVCILAFSGCENYNNMMDETPQEYVNMAAENTTEAMVKSAFAEEAAIIEKAVKDGTMGFSFSYDDIKMNMDSYVNEADKKSSGTYVMEIGGEKAEIYYAVNGDSFKVGESGKSGENVFEFNAKTLADDLAGSIFAPGSGSSMEIPQEDYDMIVEYLGQVSSALEGEGEETSEKYAEAEKLINDMMSEATVEKKVDITVDETEVKANILTFNFDKADMEQILDACVDIAMEEMAAQGEEVSKEELTAELDEVMNSISKMDIELVYYVNSKTHCLMQMDCTADMTMTVEEETQDIKLDMVTSYGADPETSNEVNVEITIEAAGEEVVVEILSERKSENETEVAISASVQGVSMEVVVLNFKRDGENYTISAEVPVAEAEATVEGTFKNDGKSVEATVEKVTYAMATEEIEGNVENLNIKGYIKQGGEFDDREAKNFFELTEEELMTIVENISNDFGALAGNTEVGGTMTEYVDASNMASVNANAKTVYTAFSAALTEMAVEGVEFDDFEFYNETSGDLNVTTTSGYAIDIAEYLGDEFTGYYYVNLDPYTYIVNFALWSETPIDYFYQYGEFDQEMFAEDGDYIGCYPLYEE
ncbi:MAG: hypothetical protein IJ305_04335 [Oscillospiraceae bacterium]|nr:hypothetical protein [Oscillospiraceae bacterium]